MTAEQWADAILGKDMLLPPNAQVVTKESISRQDLVEWVQRIQQMTVTTFTPMPGAGLTAKEISEMSALVENVDSKFKNRVKIDLAEWERLPAAFRRMRDYALYLQGPLSDIVNDNTAHYSNWARIRQESYNEALVDAIKAIEDAETELEKRDIRTSRRMEMLGEQIPDILMQLRRKTTDE
jgi:HAMP domain-containing protein